MQFSLFQQSTTVQRKKATNRNFYHKKLQSVPSSQSVLHYAVCSSVFSLLSQKPFSCSKCDKKFPQAGSLKTHERIHIDEKPFTYSMCEKAFSRASDIMIQERVHVGEKPFCCSKCDKKFTQASNSKTLEKIHMRSI